MFRFASLISAVLRCSELLSVTLFYTPMFIAVLRCIAFRSDALIYDGLCIFAGFRCAAECLDVALCLG